MNRCVFFDRDGVVNPSPGPGYVERREDFHLHPAFIPAAQAVQARGYGIAIVTNQRGVARGMITPEALADIHAHMTALLRAAGVELLGIYCCTHERNTCTCRKPQPGLLLAAARAHALDLGACWMVGDNETDVEAGRRAGCRTVLVSRTPGRTRATVVVDSIAELAGRLAALLDADPASGTDTQPPDPVTSPN